MEKENINLKKLPKYMDEAELNQELEKEIMSIVPEEFSSLEKAFYIYKELCKRFTYDEEQLVGLTNATYTINHSNIERIKEINSNNNKIICHEFSVIYAKFLDKIGIDYEIIGNDEYGTGHTYLNLLVGNFYISVDSVEGIVSGDLPKAKRGIPLQGFKLINYCDENKSGFYTALNNVDNYSKKIENEKFYSLLDQYKCSMEFSCVPFSAKERLDLLFKKIEKSNLPIVDQLSYILDLHRNIFSGEFYNNCIVSIIRDNRPVNSKKRYGVVSVIVFNDKDVFLEPDNNAYCVFDEQNQMKIYSLNELQKEFDNNKFDFLSKYRMGIPGVLLGGRVSDFKASHSSK